MAFENSAGLNVHNQYGPRKSGGGQGVHHSDDGRFYYVIDQASQGLQFLFPRGGGVFVTGIDKTFVKTGTVTSVTIGNLEVSGATEAAPIRIPDSNTGECVQTGMTVGRVIVNFKKEAGYEADVLPAFPSDFSVIASMSILPATASIDVSDASTAQLTVTVTPTGASPAVIYTSSDPTKATVDANGLVHPVAAGSATITAKSVANPSLTDTCVVTVTA